MSSCNNCRYQIAEGSRDTSGGTEAVGFDQVGCGLPFLVEAYSLCEPLAIVVEGLLIQAAESTGCRFQAPPTVEGNMV